MTFNAINTILQTGSLAAAAMAAVFAFLARNHVQKLQITVDGKMERLLDVTKALGTAEGVASAEHAAQAAQAEIVDHETNGRHLP